MRHGYNCTHVYVLGPVESCFEFKNIQKWPRGALNEHIWQFERLLVNKMRFCTFGYVYSESMLTQLPENMKYNQYEAIFVQF